jgi:hypothetical protein
MPVSQSEPRFTPARLLRSRKNSTAASILLREGAGEMGILIDGLEGWSAVGLPLEMLDTPLSNRPSRPP